MPLKLKSTVQHIGRKNGSLFTIIPKPIVDTLNLKKGDKLEMYLDEKDRLIIEKAK